MTIVSALSPLSLTQFFYDSGKPVKPVRLFFYKPGTEDRVTVYSDAGLGSAYDQPVLSGGSGRVPPIYVGTEPYRVRVFDSYGSLIEDIDYLPGAVSATGGGSTGSVLTDAEKQQLLQTGDYVIQFSKGAQRPGFVRANGGLIGPGGFTGSGFPDIERKNDDCHALFVYLWGQDGLAGQNVLEVVPTKGADADSDWFSLAKLIRLPDLRGRALMGIDGTTVSASAPVNLLTGVAISPATGSLSKPGSYGGTATATMTAAQLAAHSHTLTAAGTGITVAAATSRVTIAAAGTGISIAGAVANLAAAATGVYTGYAATGVYTGGSPTGIVIAGSPTGISLVDPGHAHNYTDLSGGPLATFYPVAAFSLGTGTTSYNTTGVSISDPWHGHGVSDPWHSHPIGDPQHVHPIGDPTHNHGQSAHVHGVSDPTHAHTVVDPTHAHTLTDPGHTHAIAATGSSSPLTTVSPFSLATVYIKL